MAIMTFYVGTSGYSFREWKGSFYPKDLSAKKMLAYYSERFRAVEINNTFRRFPRVANLEAWAAEVPAQFRFVLKAHQRITHTLRLRNEGATLSDFVTAVQALKQRLGPALFQLPPTMKKDAGRLREFLSFLPTSLRAAFEFRHQSWFDEDVFDTLRDHHAAMVIAEAEDDLDIPFVSTADWAYLRLRKPEYTASELKKWAKRVQDEKWHDVFVFFKHEDAGTGPKLAQRFLDLVS